MQRNKGKIILILVAFVVFVFSIPMVKSVFAQDTTTPLKTRDDYLKWLDSWGQQQSLKLKQKNNAFSISTQPQYPGPHTEVRAKIISYSFDTPRSYFTWYLNGKIIEQGLGKNSISFKTGDIGSIINLSASVTTEDDINVQSNRTIKINDVDLLWQANTYTPPFYKGRAEPTEGSSFKVVAVPHGMGSSSNLIYKWDINYRSNESISGLGKNSFTRAFSDLRTRETIHLTVSTVDGNNVSEQTLHLMKKEPEILFYEESPLEGVLYQKELGSTVKPGLLQSEVVVRAEPYFFLKKDVDFLSYKWTVNNKPAKFLSKPNVIGLTTPPDSTKGLARVKLQIDNPKSFLLQVTNEFKLSF